MYHAGLYKRCHNQIHIEVSQWNRDCQRADGHVYGNVPIVWPSPAHILKMFELCNSLVMDWLWLGCQGLLTYIENVLTLRLAGRSWMGFGWVCIDVLLTLLEHIVEHMLILFVFLIQCVFVGPLSEKTHAVFFG